jgi:hypothetical protein
MIAVLGRNMAVIPVCDERLSRPWLQRAVKKVRHDHHYRLKR